MWWHSEPKAQGLTWRGGGGKVIVVRGEGGWSKAVSSRHNRAIALWTHSSCNCMHKIKTINLLAWRKKGDHEPLPLKICRVDASKGGKSAFIKSTAPVGWACFSGYPFSHCANSTNWIPQVIFKNKELGNGWW